MSILDHVIKVVGTIIPDMDADPQHQLKWRLTIALLVMGSILVQAVHVLIACGWLSTFGISGFAYANDMDAIQQVQARMEVRQIDKLLMDLEANMCRAAAAGKPTRYIHEQIRSTMWEYQSIAGRVWVRPTCSELGE